jgi:hypothetical protein
MKRIARWLAVLPIVVGVCLWLTSGAMAAEPPIITKVESQVTVLSDGGLDVKYRLTFLETEPRSGITKMGPFDAGHRMLDYHIEHAGEESPISLSDQGGGFYGAGFGFDTEAGEEYTVYIHYTVGYTLDETTVDGVSYRVLAWAPIQWNLEIDEQVVTFILPIELPEGVTQPEQVTDAIVDAAGILVDDSVLASFDRWVYYPTPDEATGKNWLSIYVSKMGLPPQYHFMPQLYVPSTYFSGPVEPPVEAQPEPEPTSKPKPSTPEKAEMPPVWGFALCFVGAGVGTAGAIVFAAFRRAAPKAAPEEYEAPEIELETFEKPGLVPDLDAIEAAMVISDTTRVITLAIMGLVQRGVLTVVNRKPLQLEVTNPDLEMADYERALVEGIADDGTLPPSAVDRVLKVLSVRLQKKVWNADAQATRETYRRKADEAWDEYGRAGAAQTWDWNHPLFHWMFLSRNYPVYAPAPATVSAGTKLGAPSAPAGPFGAGGGARVAAGGRRQPDGWSDGGGSR